LLHVRLKGVGLLFLEEMTAHMMKTTYGTEHFGCKSSGKGIGILKYKCRHLPCIKIGCEVTC
jgi:hypothetical protein